MKKRILNESIITANTILIYITPSRITYRKAAIWAAFWEVGR